MHVCTECTCKVDVDVENMTWLLGPASCNMFSAGVRMQTPHCLFHPPSHVRIYMYKYLCVFTLYARLATAVHSLYKNILAYDRTLHCNVQQHTGTYIHTYTHIAKPYTQAQRHIYIYTRVYICSLSFIHAQLYKVANKQSISPATHTLVQMHIIKEYTYIYICICICIFVQILWMQ